MKLLIINGPNLNLLGQREPGIYGTGTMDACLQQLREQYAQHELLYFQSNIEGELIDRLQQADREGVQGPCSMLGLIPTRALHCTTASAHSISP